MSNGGSAGKPRRQPDPRAHASQSAEAFHHARFTLADGTILTTTETIQVYPGKRVLVHGRLDGRHVVAKFYIGRIRGWWEWHRGLRGARALMTAGVPTASIAHTGFVAAANAWLAVIDFIQADRPWPPSRSPGHTGDDEDPSELEWHRAHRIMLATLAQHHEHGLVQNDLNWTNFIPRGQQLYSIDGDRVRRHAAPLAVDPSLRNLCRFYAYKSDFPLAEVCWGYQTYCAHRGWESFDWPRFRAMVVAARRRIADRFVERSLRGWKYFRRERAGGCIIIRDRRRLSASGLKPMLHVCKHAAPSTDGTIRTVGEHAFRIRALQHPGQARHAWRRALLLRRLRIPAELPAALIEHRGLPWRRRGCLVTRARLMTPLPGALPGLDPETAAQALDQLGRIVGLLSQVDLALDEPDPERFGFDRGTIVLRSPECVVRKANQPRAPAEFLAVLATRIEATCHLPGADIASALRAGMDAGST